MTECVTCGDDMIEVCIGCKAEEDECFCETPEEKRENDL
jgi:hypothetical protein